MFFENNIIVKLTALFVLVLSLSACSTNVVKKDQIGTKNPDRFEGFNRKMFAFNDTVDGLLLKPAAKAYKAVTPTFIDGHIGNFFSNLDDVGNVINNSLQFKVVDAGSDLQRILLNSTLGFAGLVDIASAMGIEKHDEDFGQTLAKWGVKSGPYLMLPLLGPTTIRDVTAKLTVDRYTDPTHYSDENIALFITETLKKRSDLFAEEEVLAGFSDDKYSALRDVWLQNRQFLINDGKLDEDAGSDMIDELESLDNL